MIWCGFIFNKSVEFYIFVKNKTREVVKLIDKLFIAGEEFKNDKLTANEIKRKWNSKEYQNNIKELDEYLKGLKTENNFLLDKAKNYYLNQRNELYTFLEDG